ncbi:MAG: MFS transporter [Spongiibacteraceae bacterium]|nr:MFS transporter [Spongiibacteraceae bacterium]
MSLSATTDAAAAPFSLRPLLLSNFGCMMAMMAFVAVIGPLVRVLGLQEWQAGATVTISGVLWMALATFWGRASDRLGRRTILLIGVGGFAFFYLVLALFIDYALLAKPGVLIAFAGLMFCRAGMGAFFAGVPGTANALVADHVEPSRRAGAMATVGASMACGVVLGPAVAAMMVGKSLSLPLYATAVLPLLAFLLLFFGLPKSERRVASAVEPVRLNDARIRRPMVVAFATMFCMATTQIVIGFYALDRLGLPPGEAARAAGVALALVGIALVVSQTMMRYIAWRPERLILIGALVSALGFGCALLATSAPVLWSGYFIGAAGMGWIFPSFSALTANAVEAGEQGAAAGAVASAQGFGNVVGPMAATLLYDLSPQLPYGLVALLLVFVALMMWRGPA